MLKAIETEYNGYRFRSRLEARWAVFFDVLGIKYEYEKEGYELDGTWYLPDFWLPEQQCWIEIKGQKPTEEEIKKIMLLSRLSNKRAYIFAGDIWIKQYDIYAGDEGDNDNGAWYQLVECPCCEDIIFDPQVFLSWHYKDGKGCRENVPYSEMSDDRESGLIGNHCYNSPKLLAAYTAARQNRFQQNHSSNLL